MSGGILGARRTVPKPMEKSVTVVATISHVTVEDDHESLARNLVVSITLLGGTVLEIHTASDACARDLANQIQLERGLDAHVMLIGPSGVLSPYEPIYSKTDSHP